MLKLAKTCLPIGIFLSLGLLLSNKVNAQHSDPELHAEHMAAVNLISDNMITHTVVQSGLWSNSATWQNGALPSAGANISVPENLRLEVDILSDTNFNSLRVDGEIYFSNNRNAKIIVETIIVRTSGSLSIADEDNRLQEDKLVQILFSAPGPINRTWDPKQLSRGIVSHGKTRIFGSKKKAFYKIEGGAPKDATSITVDSIPTGWKVGDTVVITGRNEIGWGWKTNVGHVYFGTEDEERIITSIVSKVITLNAPLTYSHLPQHPGMPLFVANYTRNVVFQTLNAQALPSNQRAHTMFMHNKDVIVKGAGFYDLGRTDKTKPLDDFLRVNQADRDSDLILDSSAKRQAGPSTNIRGRYPVHFHRTGGLGAGTMPSICEGNAVMRSPGWGFISHESLVEMDNNASYDVFGSHFVSEDGDELGTFRNNIAIKAKGSNMLHKNGTEGHDLGHTGTGFWFEARNILVEGNVAAGMSDSGIHYFHRNSVKSPIANIDDLRTKNNDLGKGNTSLSYVNATIEASNNTVIASGKALHVTKAGPNQGHELRNMFDGLYAYNVVSAVHLEYTAHYTIKNFVAYCDPVQENFSGPGTGFILHNNTQNVALQNGIVHGFNVGISAGQNFDGLGVNTKDTPDVLVVDVVNSSNTTFINTIDNPTDSVVPNDPAMIQVMSGSSLVPGRLSFVPDATLNLSQPSVGHWWNETTNIPGVMTDSAGTKPIVLHIYNAGLRDKMMPKGYFTRENGSKYILVKHYIADRLTGETREIFSTFEFNPSVTPNLGQPTIPTFVTQPTNMEAKLGSHVTFSCKGTVPGYYSVSYKWKKNGVEIPDAHYPDYTIQRVKTSDLTDNYSCVISGIAGSRESAVASVFTKAPAAPSGLRVR